MEGKVLKFPKKKTVRRQGQILMARAEHSIRVGNFKNVVKAGVLLGFFSVLFVGIVGLTIYVASLVETLIKFLGQ
jgi:hypothetical protein